ncbi:PQQ-binding-like beta-propeller repeat protein [Anatilimnocola floriformis]|uniref:PQQ-binding-like beta-propeller repeat protein n=1 Tax=Anatilimnocola floriformis TaxID=2948575 RepID=UPI0020C1DA86|nr:PQQ-binding-like beta-propeller repeat protein [Anatilimnocola floriformis]
MTKPRSKRPTLADRYPALQSWFVPLSILLVVGLLIVFIHAGWFKFTMMPANEILVLVGALNFLLYCWVRGFSAWPLQSQMIAITTLVATQAGALQMVRLDGFAGDGRPIWEWRFKPTPRQLLEEHQQKRRDDPEPEKIDLTRTTQFDSPGFRGEFRDGVARNEAFAIDWQAEPPRELWRQPIGSGWSSFAVVGEYAVTMEQRGEDETTVCYEINTGRQAWEHRERSRFYEVTSGEGPRATPTIHNGCVFSLGATGILNCLDVATGKPKWTVNILTDNQAENRIFGVTGSPLIVGSHVIVNSGGRDSSLSAYDLATGERVWKGGASRASYSSPQLANFLTSQQVLDFNADGLAAHNLATGELLWQVPWVSNPAERNNVCQPVVLNEIDGRRGDFIFIASGYGMGCALLEVTQHAGKWQAEERWRNRNLKAKFSSVVVHDGHVYGFDEAILTCLDLTTGRRCWKGGRYNYGQLLLAGSHLLVQLESGEVAIVQADPEKFTELSRFTALRSRTWNHPVLVGRRLLVRNDREAACFELPIARNAAIEE